MCAGKGGSLWYSVRRWLGGDQGDERYRMATLAERSIIIKSGDLVGTGVVQLQEFNQRDRLLRALKAWGLFWLAAAGVFFTFIPAVHVVLAVVFFIMGPVTAYKRYTTAFSLDRVHGTCPAHLSEFIIELESSDRLPMWVHCPGCNASLHLLEKEEPSAA